MEINAIVKVLLFLSVCLDMIISHTKLYMYMHIVGEVNSNEVVKTVIYF